MADSVEYKEFRTIETGTVEWSKLKTYLHEIEEAIENHKREIEGLGRLWSGSITFAVDTPGTHTILKGSRHLRAKITNAFMTLGDSAGEPAAAQIEGFTDVVRFTDSEKAGKVRIFKLLRKSLSFIDSLNLVTTSNRKMVVTITLESAEE